MIDISETKIHILVCHNKRKNFIEVLLIQTEMSNGLKQIGNKILGKTMMPVQIKKLSNSKFFINLASLINNLTLFQKRFDFEKCQCQIFKRPEKRNVLLM